MLPRVDLVIGAVLVPGARAPKLLNRELLRLMPKGSVFVDIAHDDSYCDTNSNSHCNGNSVDAVQSNSFFFFIDFRKGLYLDNSNDGGVRN
jgi:NAD/NADP transhydrogenase alpha subunit